MIFTAWIDTDSFVFNLKIGFNFHTQAKMHWERNIISAYKSKWSLNLFEAFSVSIF